MSIDTIRSVRGRPCDFAEARPATISSHFARGTSASLPSACEYRWLLSWNAAASFAVSPSYRPSRYVQTTASIGFSRLGDCPDEETVLRHSDVALYAAKRSGRNDFAWFDEELERELTETATRYSQWGQKLERELARIDPAGAPGRRFDAQDES